MSNGLLGEWAIDVASRARSHSHSDLTADLTAGTQMMIRQILKFVSLVSTGFKSLLFPWKVSLNICYYLKTQVCLAASFCAYAQYKYDLNQTGSECVIFNFVIISLVVLIRPDCVLSLAGIYINMQLSSRLLTALHLSVTITQSQVFQGKSEGGGEVLQSFRLGSRELEPAGSISPEKVQFDTFSSSSSGATLNADLSQPLSDPKQPVPVDLSFTQGAAVDRPGASAFDFAGLNSPSYLAQQPEQFIPQSRQAQAEHLASDQDPGRNLQPASNLIALGCDSSSAGITQEVLDYPPGLQAERPGRRAKIKRLRPRQGNFCPNNPSEISTEAEISIDNPNPAFYPGGWLQHGKDIITGVRLKRLKQCTRATITLCCNGPQAGLDVRDCAFCMCLGTDFFFFVFRPCGTDWLIWDAVSATGEPRCYNGGIWCCSRLSVSL